MKDLPSKLTNEEVLNLVKNKKAISGEFGNEKFYLLFVQHEKDIHMYQHFGEEYHKTFGTYSENQNIVDLTYYSKFDLKEFKEFLQE